MKFRLSNLFLLVVLVAVALGWYSDRARLASDNVKLNAECAEWFSNQVEIVNHVDDTNTIVGVSSYPATLVYDSHDPEDRARYRQGKRSKLETGQK